MAGGKESHIPPGFKHCRDDGVLYAYQLWHGLDSSPDPAHTDKEYAAMVMRLTDKLPQQLSIDSSSTPFKEPAYWFLEQEMNPQYESNYKYEDIKKRNVPLANFASGISTYFHAWVRPQTQRDDIYDYKSWTEEYFLKSIFTAAGRTEKDAEGFRELEDMGERERILQGLMSELKKKSFDEQLAAAWSSCWLTNHYFLEGKADSLGNLMNEFEVNLRKHGKNKYNLESGNPLKIRGPPYYYDDSGSFKV